MYKYLTAEANRFLSLMARGGALRVPYSDQEPSQVVRRQDWPYALEDWPRPDQLVVPDEVRDEILESGVVCLMTRKTHRNRLGWQEMGFDGTKAEFWVHLQ